MNGYKSKMINNFKTDKEYEFYFFFPAKNCAIALIYKEGASSPIPKMVHRIKTQDFPVLPYLLSQDIKFYISNDLSFFFSYDEDAGIPTYTFEDVAEAFAAYYKDNLYSKFINKNEKIILFSDNKKFSLEDIIN